MIEVKYFLASKQSIRVALRITQYTKNEQFKPRFSFNIVLNCVKRFRVDYEINDSRTRE